MKYWVLTIEERDSRWTIAGPAETALLFFTDFMKQEKNCRMNLMFAMEISEQDYKVLEATKDELFTT